MAIYTTFFLADPDELSGGFPGWKLPLPAPVRREIHNWFTKQMVTIETREPEWPDETSEPVIPQHRVAAIQGRYEDYLEGRLPTIVRESRHWVAKGLTDIELKPLLKAIGASTELESPLYAPPSTGAVLREFPPDFISKIIECDQSGIAKQWAAEMSTPEHTHSVTGKRLYNGWTTDQAMQILTLIVSLARKAVPGQKMYLLIEP